MFTTHKFLKSFDYAWQGIIAGFRQRNMKIHGSIALFVLSGGIFLRFALWQWLAVIILVGLVFTAELFNSSIEELADVVKSHNKLDYPATKAVRDLAAGAVLVVSITAALAGLLIFGFSLY